MGINAGKLNQMIRVMELTKSADGWEWTERRKAWASVETSDKSNIFSSVGIGARTVTFTIRRQSIDLHCAIQWNGKHGFLTGIEPTQDRLHYVVTAAMVNVVSCVAEPDHAPQGATFPAALTEKYIRHEQLDPMAVNSICYVLVTPKPVDLDPGSLVDISGTPYHVLTAHTLDENKNEYEIMRTVDL